MADYFFVLDGAEFENAWRPALASAWRERRFDPARPLCARLVPAARVFAERYHTAPDESVLERVAGGPVPFDRALWRTLVGEVLLFGALEIPEFQVNAETLTCLLTPPHLRRATDRAAFAPIQQVLAGSRDLTFGPAVYRPEHAGYNPADDVRRLARYLADVRPDEWQPADLSGLPDIPEEDRADELSFTREWFPVLVDLYDRSARAGRSIVHESIF